MVPLLSPDNMEAGRAKAIAQRKAESARLTKLVLELIQAGHTQSEIARSLNKSRQSINRIAKRARQDGALN